MLDIAIIGAGLSGLSLAHKLGGTRKIAVFEARDRCGGRILTQASSAAATQDSTLALDLGPTWLWPDQQPRIGRLINQLGLSLFQQWDSGQSVYQIDPSHPPSLYVDTETHAGSRRIKGGCGELISGLLQQVPDTLVHLDHRLLSLVDHETHIDLAFATAKGNRQLQARQVVLTVPPRLLANSIDFTPSLSPKFVQLLRDTPTWMAGHAKVLLVYEQAFWRRMGYSGNALLRYPGAVLAELYDACPTDSQSAVLFGFFGIPAAIREYYRDQLEELVVQQITGLFGEAAANPLQILIQDWSIDALTATSEDQTPPVTHPVYGHPWLQLDHWQDKLYFCGSETATDNGGYMEGALEAAERVYKSLML